MTASTGKPNEKHLKTKRTTRVISGFRRDVDDISAILGYDASSKVKKS
jgi:hypothetical protein